MIASVAEKIPAVNLAPASNLLAEARGNNPYLL